MNVADTLAQTLRLYGTSHFFQVTGGDQALWLALRREGIRMILARSESGATYMADGYARMIHGPSFVYGQYGPGVANVAAALADPYWAQSSVISLTSSTRTTGRHRFEYQELDQLAINGPVTVWNKDVVKPERAAQMLRDCIRAATAMPGGGPAHLEVPTDLLRAEVQDVEIYREPGLATAAHGPDPSDIEAAVAELRNAERPMVLAGNGVVQSGAFDELARFLAETGIPVATTPGGKGAVDETASAALGVVGRYSRAVANRTLVEADTVLVLGTRLGGMSTNGYRLPAPDASIVHVDLDPRALGTIRRERVSILADLRPTLVALTEAITASGPSPGAWSAWRGEVTRRVADWHDAFRHRLAECPSRPIHPLAAVDVLSDTMAVDDVLVADTGYMAAWTAALFPARRAGRYYLRAVGSLGWAVPAALGAQLATPARRVVAVTGDGGLGYHLAEMEVAARCGIPAIVVVMNNDGLAFEYHEQKHHWGGQVVDDANNFLPGIDYAAAARALGAKGERVTTIEELRKAVSRALDDDAPTLIDAVTDREPLAPVTNYDDVEPRVV